MKIAVIGATGTIGAALVDLLQKQAYDVIPVSRKSDPGVDIAHPASIEAFFKKIGPIDGLISVAGDVAFGPLAEIDDDQLRFSIDSKLLGQINLVRKGLDNLRPNGVAILTGGMLFYRPTPGTYTAVMLNAAVEGFVKGAAKDLTQNRRILVVHPPLVRETAIKMGMQPGSSPDAATLAQTYLKALQSDLTGEVIFAEGHED
ncbi:MAG: short chain dehydrogenase [Calditrichaeota bacterium]|nr:MAG: short chain dehydrogenase [Calditrichota bacterium]